jgi:hypothetical protein
MAPEVTAWTTDFTGAADQRGLSVTIRRVCLNPRLLWLKSCFSDFAMMFVIKQHVPTLSRKNLFAD